MKKFIYLIYILFISFMLILESTLFSRLIFFNVKPNLILILTLILTFFINYEQSIFFALIAGCIEDFYIGRMICVNTIAMVLTVFIILKFVSRIIKENLITPIFLIFLGSLINGIIMFFLIFLAGNISFLNILYLKNLFFESIYNLILSFIFYPLIYLFFYSFKKEEIK